jgi:hypothetical protein
MKTGSLKLNESIFEETEELISNIRIDTVANIQNKR